MSYLHLLVMKATASWRRAAPARRRALPYVAMAPMMAILVMMGVVMLEPYARALLLFLDGLDDIGTILIIVAFLVGLWGGTKTQSQSDHEE